MSKWLINEALADCKVESIEDAYELLCEHVVGFLGDDLDEVSKGIDVNMETEGTIIL